MPEGNGSRQYGVLVQGAGEAALFSLYYAWVERYVVQLVFSVDIEAC